MLTTGGGRLSRVDVADDDDVDVSLLLTAAMLAGCSAWLWCGAPLEAAWWTYPMVAVVVFVLIGW